MIDFHSHILPGIDDGSRDIQETLEMLRLCRQQGVSKMVATPHFYAHHDSVEEFLARRQQALFQVRRLAETETWIPKIIAGAEVYYFPGIGQAHMLQELCVEGTELLLLEMPFVQWTEEMLKQVRQIIDQQRLTVILAHVERFYEFQKRKKIWNEIIHLPLYVQVNSGSLFDRKMRKVIFRLLKEDFPVIVGSDCHNTGRRPPDLAQGMELIRRKFGEDVTENIDCCGKEMLEIYEKK